MSKTGKYIKYIFTFCKAWIFILLQRTKSRRPSVNKNVAFNLPDTDYHRYLFVLIRFFQKEGYTISVKPYPRRVTRLLLDKYASKLITDKTIQWSDTVPKSALVINSDNLSSKYFAKTKGHKIPMCQHPAMYELGLDHYSPNVNKKNAIYFAGDFREYLYTTISDLGYFSHPNRLETLKLWQKAAKKTKTEAQLIIVDNKDTNLSPRKYREQLAQHSFFLALPGIHMPISHNIIEALSLTTIPIIHQTYAELMSPPLVHLKTAFVYSDFDNLDNTIVEILFLNTTLVADMQKAIAEYYILYLTHKAVISNLLTHKEDLQLIAEWNSIPKK